MFGVISMYAQLSFSQTDFMNKFCHTSFLSSQELYQNELCCFQRMDDWLPGFNPHLDSSKRLVCLEIGFMDIIT